MYLKILSLARNSATMKDACAMIISGRVQGVMFRDFAQRKATALGLTGEVENLPDGTVRVRAEGEREVLEKLVTLLKKGVPASQVDSVSVRWEAPRGSFDVFSIRY